MWIIYRSLSILIAELSINWQKYLDFQLYCGLLIFLCMICTTQVPGATGNFVFIKDAVYEKPDTSILPFPTYFVPEDEDSDDMKPLIANLGDVDPFMVVD